MNAAREAGRTTVCQNNLKQIGLALMTYESQYGCYPPAYVADANGEPQHSWRVLILPQLGRQDLFNRYDFAEPWNGPNNLQLATQMPDVYGCPADTDAPRQFTSYVAAIGPDRMFPGDQPRKLREVVDGLSNTIAVMEFAGSQINWLEPRDGPVLGESTATGAPSSSHPRGATVLFADGSVQSVASDVDAGALEAMLTVDGDDEVFDAQP
jgi:prepilin-type processing-associated H-X9-DG protein